MARAKTESFDDALVRTAGLAKSLSHPARIRILEILAARKGCICGGLVEILPLAQSTISQHLGELRNVGLIRGQVDGPRICYCLDAKVVAEALAAFKDVLGRLCEPRRDAAEGLSPDSCRLRLSSRGISPGSGPRLKTKPEKPKSHK
ncbi:MAG: metalloregulator ArsR/SmtB family transcription factor [Candidatus Aminicenantes bacterium]|nr:metalloregulator ArsR/SmtB family transcription factor [Candidatus Aminicenantes bacterium]